MSAWKFSKLDTKEIFPQHMIPHRAIGMVSCDTDVSQSIGIKASLIRGDTLATSFLEVQTAVANILRAPWEIGHFTLTKIDGDGNFLYDTDGVPIPATTVDGSVITSDDFKNWVLINEGLTGTNVTLKAHQMKPADWLAAYPSWPDADGGPRTTDFFTDYFKSEDTFKAGMYNVVTDRYKVGEVRHLEKECRIKIEPMAYVNHPGDDDYTPLTSLSDELLIQSPFRLGEHGLVKSANHYDIAVNAIDDDFEAKSSDFGYILSVLFSRYILIPFDFSKLPRKNGFDYISFAVRITLSLGPHTRNTHQIYLDFELDPDSYLSRLDVMSFDFSRYNGNHSSQIMSSCHNYHQNTFSNSTHDTPQFYNDAAASHVEAIRILQRSLHEKSIIGENVGIDSQLDDLNNRIGKTSFLFTSSSNENMEHSEGVLQLFDNQALLENRALIMHDDGLITDDEYGMVKDLVLDASLQKVFSHATETGIYSDEILTMDRPLHKEPTEKNEQIQKDLVKQQKRHSDPSIPLGWEIVLIVLGVIVLGAIIAMAYILSKKKHK